MMVPRRDRPDVGVHRLGAPAVARVARPVTGTVVLVVAKVIGHLALGSRLEKPLGQLLEQPALAGELDPTLLGLPDQLVEQLPIQRVEPHRLTIDDLPGHGISRFHHAHQMQLHHVQELHRRPYSPITGDPWMPPIALEG